MEELVALENLCFTEPWSRDAFEAEFRHSYSRTWGWFDEKAELAGYLTGWLVFEEFHIANLAVHPAKRRGGIAQALLDHALKWAVDRQARVSLLEVRASNRPAMQLYLRNGYESVAVRKNYYSNPLEDALILRKPLAEPSPPGAQIPDSA